MQQNCACHYPIGIGGDSPSKCLANGVDGHDFSCVVIGVSAGYRQVHSIAHELFIHLFFKG